MLTYNRLVLIGNGFDLAHGLKTTYKDFLDWYMCEAFSEFCTGSSYQDELIQLTYTYAGQIPKLPKVSNMEEVITAMKSGPRQEISYRSIFFKKLVDFYKMGTWVNIERLYFEVLKDNFDNIRHEETSKLNKQLDFIIEKLFHYFEHVNTQIVKCAKLPIYEGKLNLKKGLQLDDSSPVTFLNFNYTDTLLIHSYANKDEVIFIHGRAADINRNPLIFGYGDESDSAYQRIEDSNNNVYLDHIKSFGYFKTDNYSKLISLIDSDPYVVYIVGHSCGLSDRILLREIFEHYNCHKIEIFYHQRKNGTDNFKEITQEISRHFRPTNKGMMRKKVGHKDAKNVIPQN